MIRWSIRIALCLMLASAAYNAGALWRHRADRPGASPAASLSTGELPAVATAHPMNSPLDVVATQMSALGQCRDSRQALHQVYALASPSNRQVVGPIDRFAGMLLSPTFRPLVDHQHSIIGRPAIRGSLATVMVTLVDPQRQPAIFHFYLERQTDAPYENCWMTYGVTRDVTAEQTSDGAEMKHNI